MHVCIYSFVILLVFFNAIYNINNDLALIFYFYFRSVDFVNRKVFVYIYQVDTIPWLKYLLILDVLSVEIGDLSLHFSVNSSTITSMLRMCIDLNFFIFLFRSKICIIISIPNSSLVSKLIYKIQFSASTVTI